MLNFAEDPDDPNEPGHAECLIMSLDRCQLLLFISVPDTKQVKNWVHLDLRPVDRTREQEVERVLTLGASYLADHRRPDGSGWITLADRRITSSASCPRPSSDLAPPPDHSDGRPGPSDRPSAHRSHPDPIAVDQWVRRAKPPGI